MLHLLFNNYSFLYQVNKQNNTQHKQLEKSKCISCSFLLFVKKPYTHTSFSISESLPSPNQMDVLLQNKTASQIDFSTAPHSCSVTDAK